MIVLTDALYLAHGDRSLDPDGGWASTVRPETCQGVGMAATLRQLMMIAALARSNSRMGQLHRKIGYCPHAFLLRPQVLRPNASDEGV